MEGHPPVLVPTISATNPSQSIDEIKEREIRIRTSTHLKEETKQCETNDCEKALYLPCHLSVHPSGSKNCFIFSLETVVKVSYCSSKVYLPFYLVSALVQHRNLDRKIILRDVLKNTIQSSLFLGCYGSMFQLISCALRRIRGANFQLNFFVAAFVAAYLSLFLESEKRRREMTLATAQHATSALVNMLLRRRWLRPIPGADVLVFAASFASMYYLHLHRPSGAGTPLLGKLVGRPGDKPHRLFRRVRLPAGALRTLSGSLGALGTGILLQSVLRVFSGPSVFREPGRLFRELLSPSRHRFGLFLFLLTFLSRALSELCRSWKWLTPAAGFVSGLSIGISRSEEVSMWSLSKAVQAWVPALLPERLPGNPLFLIYALSTGIMFYNVVFETKNMRSTAWHFLLKVTGGHTGLLGHFPKLGDRLRPELDIPESHVESNK
eukprot:TRINITY_DN552_c0_g1_i1.p1 TRINITY_DN552_c0_g1~~TRINITY_DN552_c0_g1_i1.p1  ORF type:complete len:437 (-),score=27.14 TRINITY_DN552_c0_g1_i1:25-1335(-)